MPLAIGDALGLPFGAPLLTVKSSLLTGLFAYYAFETLTTDSSGNGNTLTNTNGVTQGTGIIGQAASFASASSQKLSQAATINYANDYTIAAWFNSASAAANQYIFASSHNTGFFWPGAIQYRRNGATGAVTTSNNVGVGVWGFACVTFTAATSTLSLTLNNGTPATSTTSTSPGSLAYNFGSDNAGTQFWNGLIDEAGIWTVALTPTQITNLYNGGAGVTYPFNGVP